MVNPKRTLGLAVLILMLGLIGIGTRASSAPTQGEISWKMSPICSNCNGPWDDQGRMWFETDFDDSSYYISHPQKSYLAVA